jgi:hypothetical protein
MGSGTHRALRARLGSRTNRRKHTKLNTFHQVRVEGAMRKPRSKVLARSVWSRVREMKR